MNIPYREILSNFLGILDRLRTMQDLSMKGILFFSVLLIFGLLNCILGYRLLRFWIMLFGFALGGVAGYLGGRSLGIQQNRYLLAAVIGAGLITAIVAFLIYRAGLFVMGMGLGSLISIYLIAPNSSASFFLCLLIGVAVGVLTLRYSREVLIVGTSFLGGVFAGLSLAKLLHLSLAPYGILISLGFSIIGTLLQFLLNPLEEIEETTEEKEDASDSAASKEKKETPVSVSATEEIDPLEYPEDAIDEDGYVIGPDGPVFYEMEHDR